MKKTIIKDVHEKWKDIGSIIEKGNLEVEVETYKNLLNIFQVGPCFFAIFNPANKFIEYISSNVKDITGYDSNEIDFNHFIDVIHPDDLPFFGDVEISVYEFKKQLPIDKIMKYKSRYNYRLRKKDGTYIYVLHQSITIQTTDDGSILRNLTFITDISDILQSNKMRLSMIGLDGEPSFNDIPFKSVYSSTKNPFSSRQKEILNLMMLGKSSEDIATELKISINTVRNHRKNMLTKSGCTSTNELLGLVVKEKWI